MTMAYFFEPFGKMIKSFAARNVVNEQSAGSAAVVASGDGSEGLLAGCIPNLEFDLFVADSDSASAEFDADGQIVVIAESFVGELQKQTGFADDKHFASVEICQNMRHFHSKQLCKD